MVPPGVFVIGSISTFISQKGLAFLLQAAALLRDEGERFLLLVVGDGHLRDDLHSQARNLGLAEYVRFLGWIPQASDRVLPGHRHLRPVIAVGGYVHRRARGHGCR